MGEGTPLILLLGTPTQHAYKLTGFGFGFRVSSLGFRVFTFRLGCLSVYKDAQQAQTHMAKTHRSFSSALNPKP